ncbi:MAG: hypothetical protein KHZ42_01430 [Haemophilus parainfluenzae]|jgi:hypothetical protein|nr:hypothetical protein [Haemophilus parainfluenzae]
MKKSLLILTALLSISSSAFAENFPPTYKKALSGLDILKTELQGNFLSVTFNRDEIGKQMLESVVRGICFETYLDEKFAKKLDLKRVMIMNKHYTQSFNFETDVNQYCKNIGKLNSEEAKKQYPFDSYVSER